MKRKVLSFLLVFVLAAGIGVPAVQAALGEPAFPLFTMSVTADKTAGLQPGDTVTVTVKAQPIKDVAKSFMSYQFTLDYPKEKLKLEKVTTDLAGEGFVWNGATSRAVYNAMTAEGVTVGKGGAELATAEFKVLPVAEAGEAVIGVKDAEVVRPNDSKGPVNYGDKDHVDLSLQPVLMLGLNKDKQAEVTVAKGRAGTLVAVVYNAAGRQLDMQVSAVTADPEKAQTIALTELDLTGGALVKAFLLDQNSSPICAAAELALTGK